MDTIKCKIKRFWMPLPTPLLLLLFLHSCLQVYSDNNIILLTYHRSGSSFVGENLAAHENFSYYFEPLFYGESVLENKSTEAQTHIMETLMNCDQQMLDTLRNQAVWILRKFGPNWNTFNNRPEFPPENLASMCRETPNHLAKTIRLSLKDAIDLVHKGTIPNLKIIHLVRDPRARYNSAQDENGSWSTEEKSANRICGEMDEDTQYIDILPPDVYRRVKYEDFVENPKRAVKDLYETFLRVKYTPRVQLYIDRHTKAERANDTRNEITGYYSTFRSSGFDHNHWKTSLNNTVIKRIQNQCKNVLEKYGYEFL